MLLVPIIGFKKRPILSKSYVDLSYSNNNQTTYNFTGKELGTANATRRIIVVMGAFGIQSVASVTVAGVGATELAQWSEYEPSWWIAHVPSGTTGTVSITWTGLEGGMWLGMWAVYGLGSNDCLIDAQTAGAATSDPSITLNRVRGGLMMAATRNGEPAAYGAWTGATQEFEYGASFDGINWAYASAVSPGNGSTNIWVDVNYAARLTGISIGG